MGDNVPLNVSGETRDIMSIYSPAIDRISSYFDKNPYPFYAVVLGRDSDEAIKKFVSDNWLNLHYMSGGDCLLLSIYPPNKLDQEVAGYWKGKLGDDYEKIMDKVPASAWSYEYARRLGIPFDMLPCVYLSSDLDKKGFAVKIPQWGDKDLTSLFELIFGTVSRNVKLDSVKRLASVEKEIDGFYGKYNMKLGEVYVKNHWMEYIDPKENAKKVIEILVAGVLAGLKSKVGVK